MDKSFYNILEIPETATSDEIKKSYRRLSMIYHPDKNKNNPDATAKFQKISEAYETLGDKDKKSEYDLTRKNPFLKSQSMNATSVDELFSNLFGMNLGQNMHFNAFPFDPSHSPNIRIFHNGMPVNIPGFSQKPEPIVKTIIVPIDKILMGTTVPIELERWIIQDGMKIFETETLYVQVPKGIDEGELIILKEKGNIFKEDVKGDVKIFIKIENETDFKRMGLDLLLEKKISVKEALCGFSFELKYITGRKYTITNNSGSIINNGYKKIIPNMGFSRDHHIGNLVIIFNVIFPEKLSIEIVDKLKEIDF
jgi:DnaJ-class molecular chaperone